jgi:iron complex outermembrane recepter protein
MSNRSYCRRGNLLLSASIFVAFAGMWAPVQAQTAVVGAGSEPEVVTVTAERRSTDIQSTALAITAISADTLAKSNVVQLADINGLVPSLEITKSAGFETVVTMRGVGLETPENSLTTSPGVALFIDGAYISNSVSLDQTLFDLDHVEVLRGPQGALYGESATGGAILLVTKQPELNGFSGSADVDLGTYDLHRESADVNIPLSDDFAIRVSGQQIYHDGFTKDAVYPGKALDNADDWSGKFAALWQPTSNFSATLTTEFYHATQMAAAQKSDLDPNSSPWTVSQDFEPKFDMATNLTHLNMEWDESWFAVKSVTAYQWLDNVQGEDSSRSAVSIINSYDDVASWNTSLQNYNEQLDIQSRGNTTWEWDVGLFLLAQKGSQFVAEYECYDAPPCTTDGVYPPTPTSFTVQSPFNSSPNLAYGNVTEVNRKSWAFFAQSTYHFTDQLSATVGGRLNADVYTDNGENFGGAIFGGPSANTYVHSTSDHVATWRLEVDDQFTPDNLLYVSSNRGYKPGGVNGEYGQAYQCTSPFTYGGCNFNLPLVTPNQFKPETNTAFEVGSKNKFLDDHLTANFAAFYYIYHDYQYITTDPVPFDGGMTNIPSTHMWGGEAEAHYTGGNEDRMHLDGTLSLENGAIQGNYKAIDSTVANQIESTSPNCAFNAQYYYPGCWYTVVAGAKNVGGNPPAKMPSVLGSFDASYDLAIPTGTLTPRFELVYRGSYWARIFDEPALDKVPAYTMINLNMDYVPDNSGFKVSLLVSNLTNVAGVNSQYTDPYGTGTTSRQYVPPRQVIGSVSYKF